MGKGTADVARAASICFMLLMHVWYLGGQSTSVNEGHRPSSGKLLKTQSTACERPPDAMRPMLQRLTPPPETPTTSARGVKSVTPNQNRHIPIMPPYYFQLWPRYEIVVLESGPVL